jgi:hypothetical protein
MVEFSLVVGIALAIIVGIMAAAFLFFQRSSMHDGSTAGARMAAMQTSLMLKDTIVTGKWCEAQSPVSIEQAVSQAAIQVQVNQLPLCVVGTYDGTGASPTQLIQTSPDSTKVIIQVDASPSLAKPTTVTVTLNYNAQGLGPPLNKVIAFTSSSSTVPVLSP